MARHKHKLHQVVDHGKQLGRNLLLLAHYTTEFAEFVGRFVEWMVGATRWTCKLAGYTAPAFDYFYRRLYRRRKRCIANGNQKMIAGCRPKRQ